MRSVAHSLAFGLLLMAIFSGACYRNSSETGPGVREPTLMARAVLPADTFLPDTGPVGKILDPVINGRTTPFPHNPVQGLSSLLPVGDGQYLALQDNGFGSAANSPDVPLMWYQLELRLARADSSENDGAGGSVSSVRMVGHVPLSDPDRLLPEPLPVSWPDGHRPLSGADLDPESFVMLPDGTVWIGEEFGPWLLHFDALGRLLSNPVAVPVVPSLADLARGAGVLRTPDHPDFRDLPETERLEQANLPRSGGLEGLALSSDRKRLYLAVEKAMLDDEICDRRLILEFDTGAEVYTGRHWFYRTDACAVSIASLETVGHETLLVTERDGAEGTAARIKRIYRVELAVTDRHGFLAKELVCDLLDIADPLGVAPVQAGAVGLGPRFAFPFVTPECLLVVDDRTLLVACDNNYPFSVGRFPPDTPDNTEFILIGLPGSLSGGNGAGTP